MTAIKWKKLISLLLALIMLSGNALADGLRIVLDGDALESITLNVGDTVQLGVENLHTHSYSAATCTTPATCSDPTCGETTGDIDKTNHVGGTEVRDAKEATETEDGYTGDTYCFGCGDKLADGETIPATHRHTWEWTYDSGMHWQKCDCGESSTAAQAHQFDDDADPLCDTCGYTRIIEHVHDWGEWTFNGDGTHTRTCKADSSHTETGGCTRYEWHYKEEGHYKSWRCDACGGDADRDIQANALHHVYDNDTDLTCDLCGYVRTVEGELSITGSMPAATVGEAYSASFGYTGTVSGIVFWNATGLPDGLTFDYGTGTISGTPTAAGTYSITISMGATGGGSASKSFTLTITNE